MLVPISMSVLTVQIFMKLGTYIMSLQATSRL
jgi:hypothetical protein